MSNFGATFRKARETAGLPLEKIAADTRISTRFLLAIESESFNLLPGGIFNRGFIRSYAEYLGLDAEQAVADYDRMSATTQEPMEVLRNVERDSSRRSERNLYPIAAAILVVSILAYYFVTRKPAATPPVQPTPAATASVPQPTLPPEPPAPATEVAPTTDSSPAQTAPPKPVASVPPSAPAPTPPSAATVASTAPAASVLALDVNAKGETWIRVTADGAVAFDGVLQSGAERRFSAERSIDIKIGNAGGATLRINGRDLGQLGNEGQVREFKITPENAAKIQG